MFPFRDGTRRNQRYKNLAVYRKSKRFAKCYHYKPYVKYLVKYLSEENKEIYDLLCECYDECGHGRLYFRYIRNERRVVHIINILIEKFNVNWEVCERYIGDGATEYEVELYKDGYSLASSICFVDNQEDFGQCFFGFENKLYYGNSQWHNDVKSALVDEEGIEGYEIDIEKTEFYENCIVFRYDDEYEETVYYDNYKRCEQ